LPHSMIRSYVNDRLDKSSNSPRFISNKLHKGDIVRAVILKGESKYSSNEIEINNSQPVMRSAKLIPPIPRAVSVLAVEALADDIDNDNVSYKYNWQINGKFISELSFIESGFKRDDKITVLVTPIDEEQEGRSVKLTGTISNSLPVYLNNSPSFDGKTYLCKITAEDPDGDVLSYALEGMPEGMTIDAATGDISWNVPEQLDIKYSFSISITDGHGGKIIVPLTARIGFKEEE